MSYQAPNEEQILFRQGRQILKAAKNPAKAIAQSFAGLENILTRLDTKNGDIIDAQLGVSEEPYTSAKHAAYTDLVNVQNFFTKWETAKAQLDALNTPEVKALIASMVTLCTPPPQEPTPPPEEPQE